MPTAQATIHVPLEPKQERVEIRAVLHALREDVALTERRSVNGRFAVMTTAVLGLHDQVVDNHDRVDERLSHLESDLSEVKSDLAEVKADLGEVKTDLAEVKTHLGGLDTKFGLLSDQMRVMDARIERICGWIERDELKQRPEQN